MLPKDELAGGTSNALPNSPISDLVGSDPEVFAEVRKLLEPALPKPRGLESTASVRRGLEAILGNGRRSGDRLDVAVSRRSIDKHFTESILRAANNLKRSSA